MGSPQIQPCSPGIFGELRSLQVFSCQRPRAYLTVQLKFHSDISMRPSPWILVTTREEKEKTAQPGLQGDSSGNFCFLGCFLLIFLFSSLITRCLSPSSISHSWLCLRWPDCIEAGNKHSLPSRNGQKSLGVEGRRERLREGQRMVCVKRVSALKARGRSRKYDLRKTLFFICKGIKAKNFQKILAIVNLTELRRA